MDRAPRTIALVAALLALAAVAHVVSARSRTAARPPAAAAGPSFAADVPAADRVWIVAVARERPRPEARRLIDAVDGRIRIQRHASDGRTAGYVQPSGDGFVLSLDLDTLRGLGPKIRDHVLLHEIGHVVDLALVPPELNAALDEGIPRLETCAGEGVQGGCAVPEERFADTFAKWALDDPVGPVAGNIAAGYRVPPPANLVGWAEPLAGLAP